jgi:hypothetical protein
MTSGINVAQIAAPSANVAGGMWRAPLGTALPTDTTTALDAAYVSLGYVDEDGLTRTEDRPNTPQFAWGGAKVASLQQHYNLTFKFKLMQPLDADVMKAVHSDGNVSVTAATQSAGTITTVAFNPTLNVNAAWCVESFYQLATLRFAIPRARVTQVEPVQWTHKTLALYNVTLEAFPDSQGNFGYQISDDGVVAV